ncbi:MAG: AAA family ATPase [Candidatus Fimenecus sp.]
MEKVLFASGKGGVGKSTLAVCLARALAEHQKRVLLVDCDIGIRALDLLTGLGAGAVYSWLDLLEGNCTKADALLTDPKTGISLLTAPNRLEMPVPTAAFSEMLETLSDSFDFCFLDAGAGLFDLLGVLGAVADTGVLVATPDAVSARAAAATADVLRATRTDENLRLLLNRYTIGDVRCGAVLSADEMVDLTELRLLGAVPEDMYLRVLSCGEAPSQPAKDAFDRIARRLLGESVPFREKKLKSVHF